MKYKVTEYYSDFQEEQTGTCELCFGTAWVENGSITVEDENGTETEIYLTVWDWGDSRDTELKIHTRKELEEADFGWVFDCPGIEIEEVE